MFLSSIIFFENKNHYCSILDICASSKTSGETEHKENISKPGRGGDINESTVQATVVGNVSNGLNTVKMTWYDTQLKNSLKVFKLIILWKME